MLADALSSHSVVPSEAATATVSRSNGQPKSNEPLPQEKFVWGAGIECSFIPHLGVDQFQWTQHDRVWRDDFRLARQTLGLSALRYAFPWHRIEREPGKFDWAAVDERVDFACELGLDLYVDVMHFGTPLWLRQAAGDPEFPEALERFAEALVTRYRGRINTWCPCNEPLVLSLYSGDFGFWPPHSRKWKGYMPVLSRVVQASSRAIRAIRRADPQATIVWCDHVENYKTRHKELEDEAKRRNTRRFLGLDLLLGRVDAQHPLWEWVTSYGLSELDLEWFRAHPQRPDALGLDYYPSSEMQLERGGAGLMVRRSESPIGLYGIGSAYYARYALPLLVTETSVDGHPVNREIWLDRTIEDCRRLREEGIPMQGYFWWPMIDQLDWDGALTHRIGKIHNVGIFNLKRQPDGTLARVKTPLVDQYTRLISAGDQSVGRLESIAIPATQEDQGPPIGTMPVASSRPVANGDAPRTEVTASASRPAAQTPSTKKTDRYGFVVFSHLRWGFVWQRPQQFLSRFARKHRILFVEEPFFDLKPGTEPRLDFHSVMPNVTVICPHVDPSWQKNPELPALLRKFTQQGIDNLNDDGAFDRPLLWYYSPMDSAWSLGHFDNRGVVYDCMDELSQFSGAPKSLIDNEARLMQYADVVFAGGYELGDKKRKQHHNVHSFGCGVDFAHFSKASDPDVQPPPDIDFMHRPILGWFGVVDERVDYPMVGEMARLRPNWSFAMVGPIVKIDPNLLPHAPNLYWLGGRDYQQLPSYCRAFDVNMMCFAINAATQFINPTKGLEYMATGKPIVSTPVRDVVKQWSNIVRIATNAETFVAAAEEAMAAGPSDERVRRGLELARQSSWEATVQKMQSLIDGAIGSDDRPSAAEISPAKAAELEYAYVATQGS